MVTAMAGNPRWLNVTWKNPHSWNSNFYRLRFELRYRAEWSKTFTTLMVNSFLFLNREAALDTWRWWKVTRKERKWVLGPASSLHGDE
jgi:hypothetical protein